MRKKSIYRLESIAPLKYDQETLRKYARDQVDEQKYWCEADAVAFPSNTAQVSAILRYAHRHRIAVTTRGAGSGLSGGAIPTRGGVVLSLERMNRIIDIDKKNFTVTAEAGVVTRDLDQALAQKSLFFAGYPLSNYFSCLGGNVAENAGGGRSVKYGVTSQYLLGAEVVMADGTVLRLGGKRVKDVTGYSLLGILCGSEGTLGVFTTLIFRVVARPRYRAALLLSCGDFSALEKLTVAAKQMGDELPSAIEFVDIKSAMLAKEASASYAGDACAIGSVLLEFTAMDRSSVERRLRQGIEIAAQCNMELLERAADGAAVDALWNFRRKISWLTKKRLQGRRSGEDISIPPATVSKFMQGLARISEEQRVPFFVFGHAGDGNYHIVPDPPRALSDESWEEVHHALRMQLYLLAKRVGGTISGEHGIGIKQRDYISLVLGEEELTLYRRLKSAFDPRGILNPGKIFRMKDRTRDREMRT